MTLTLFDVIIALFNAVTSLATTDYFYSIFSKRNGRYNIHTFICLIAFFISPLIFGKSILNMIILFIIPFFVTFNYDFKIYNKILFTFIFVVVCCLSEILTQFIITSVINEDMNYIYENRVLFFFGAIFSKLLALIICLITGSFKKEILVGKFRFKWIPLYSLPLATYFTVYALFKASFLQGYNTFIMFLSFIALMLLVLSNLLVFKLVNNIHSSVVNEQRLEMAEDFVKQQEVQYNVLFNRSKEVYKIRHDNKNFLLGIMSELESGNSEKVHDLIKERLSEYTALDSNTVTGNSIVDTVLGFKFSQAEEKGIKIDFEHKNLISLKMSGVDFSILAGNALDNAIEASMLLAPEKRYIHLFMVIKDEHLLFTVTNNVIENTDVKRLQTTKSDTESHGFGIINMQSIAAKYNGDIVFECENNVFKTIVAVENGL